MDDIESFRRQYLEDIKADANATGAKASERFLAEATKEMAAYDVCPEAEPCFYRGTGKRNRAIEVHGYADTDGEGGLSDCTLSIFACDYSGEPDPPRMTETEFNDYARRCLAFIEESADGSIEAASDPDSAGHGLAKHIRMGYHRYDRIFIYVVTDRLRSVRFREIKDRDLGGKPVLLRLIDMAYIRETLGSSRPDDDRIINVSDFGFSAIPCVKAGSSNGCNSYIGSVPGLFLALIYRDYGSRLLESNVRSFLTVKTKVNKGIRNTIREDPGMFFAYNNGVALTASKVEIGPGGITSFTNLQIVNGGQTTVSLFKELKTKFKDKLSEIYVPMKLVVVSSDDAFDIVRNISIFVNTQNAVKESDLSSSSEFQIAMENASRSCSIPNSEAKWYYERTRGQYEQDSSKGTEDDRAKFRRTYDKSRRIDKIDFAKYRYLIDLRPDIISKGGQTCYSYFSRAVAKEFSEEPSSFGADYFKRVVSAAILYGDTYDAIGKSDWFKGSLRPQICAYAVSKVISTIRDRGYEIDWDEIWDRQSADESLVRFALSAGRVFQEYLSDISDAGGNPLQECRRETCWESFSAMAIPTDSAAFAHCLTSAQSAERIAASSAKAETNEAAYALRSFTDWNKVRYTLMRESADRR
ncbi:MAG: AIPR family protein [Candidatus Methanomethylophilaceae archaeon]|nr:AIPR family protein [Candidatus Methanomethylophilaceae archaeon]